MLNSGGLTPLAESLVIAVNELDKSKKDATFVLITDGKEECGGDPIKVISDFAEKGRIIELHIIGLGVDNKTKNELEKIASIGGGYFYDANDAFQLKDSLSNIAVTKLNEQVLKLKSSSYSAKTSKKLYTVDEDEKIKVKIKFKPDESIKENTSKDQSVYFIVGDTQIILKYRLEGWELYKIENDITNLLIWPSGLNVHTAMWNYMSFISSENDIDFYINMKKVYSMKKPNKTIQFRVGVGDCKISFKDLSTEIPLY